MYVCLYVSVEFIFVELILQRMMCIPLPIPHGAYSTADCMHVCIYAL